MKVCLLTANFPPEVYAGTEMVVVALGRALRLSGIDVIVVTSSDRVHDGEDVRREDYGGLPVLRLFKRLDEWDQNGLDRPRLQALVDGIFAAEQPDVLHVHSFASLGSGPTQRARARGIGTVMTFHDVWVTCPRYFRVPQDGITCPEGSGREPCIGCVNVTLGHSDLEVVRRALHGRDRAIAAEVAAAAVLTAPSHTAANMVQEHLPCARPIEVIPHGVLSPVDDGGRAAPPQPGERLRIGTFGNLVEEKGVLDLVRAVAGIDCELHLAGSFLPQAFGERVRALARELGVDVHWQGPYGPSSPHPAQRLHLAVFPSRCQETYGVVVDEALARGVPVVVSDRGALKERGAGGGVVVAALPQLAAVVHDLARDRGSLHRLTETVPRALPTIAAAAQRYLELYTAARPLP